MKKALGIGAKALVSLALLGYLLTRLNLDGLGAVFVRTVPGLFLLAVAFFALSNTLGALQWHLLLRVQRIPISFGRSLVFYLVGVFFNNVLLGNIGGDALRVYDIRRLSGHTSGGLAATAVDRFLGLFSACTLALSAWTLMSGLGGVETVSVLLPVWGGLLVGMGVVFSQRLGDLAQLWGERFLPASLVAPLTSLRRSFGAFRQQPGRLFMAWCISIGVQFCRILVYWSAGMAVGMKAELIYFIAFQPVAAVIAALPISVGGLGVRENTLVSLFAHFGVANELSTAMSLLGYAAGIIASLAGGVAFVLRRVEKNIPSSTEDTT
jgi:hypothetical protein